MLRAMFLVDEIEATTVGVEQTTAVRLRFTLGADFDQFLRLNGDSEEFNRRLIDVGYSDRTILLEPEPVKRFALFVGANYYPNAGWEDFVTSSDDLESLKVTMREMINDPDMYRDWGRIVDLRIGFEVVKA